jgi:asparagine synthetase B (glutamine-hydrolysing)
VLHDNGIVVTMAGDMGDEILGGYPKYWKLRKRFKSSGKRIKWLHILDNWLDRIKRPLKLHNLLIGRTELREELLKCYPDDIWNPDDPVGSYMALDCTAGVPEEFFMRNDKYGMAYGMEGRFPLASKTFMQYCMDIHSDVKIMHDKSDTKILSKQAYAEKLPKGIINKKKTGWTVPIQFWIDFPELKKLDPRSAEITKKCQGHGKAMIPAMIARDWAKLYQMKEY